MSSSRFSPVSLAARLVRSPQAAAARQGDPGPLYDLVDRETRSLGSRDRARVAASLALAAASLAAHLERHVPASDVDTLLGDSPTRRLLHGEED